MFATGLKASFYCLPSLSLPPERMLGVIVKGLEEKERQEKKKKRKDRCGGWGDRKEGRKVTSDSWVRGEVWGVIQS